jgi:hypothetical protein
MAAKRQQRSPLNGSESGLGRSREGASGCRNVPDIHLTKSSRNFFGMFFIESQNLPPFGARLCGDWLSSSDQNRENDIFWRHLKFYTFLAVLGAAELSFWDPNGVVFRPSITTVATFLNRFQKKLPHARIQSPPACDQTFFFKVHTNEVIPASENPGTFFMVAHLTTTLIWWFTRFQNIVFLAKKWTLPHSCGASQSIISTTFFRNRCSAFCFPKPNKVNPQPFKRFCTSPKPP